MPADSPDARGDPPGKRVAIPRNEKPTGKPGDSSDTRGVRPLKPCHRPKEMKNRQLSLPIHLIRGGIGLACGLGQGAIKQSTGLFSIRARSIPLSETLFRGK